MANNLRIIYNNVADSATMAAASEVSGFPLSNLKVDSKGSVYRTIGNSAQISLTWSSPQILDSVVLPFCNLSNQALINVEVLTDAGGNTIVDTGDILAAPFNQISPPNWKGASGINTYSFGGGTTARAYFPNPLTAWGVIITVSDPARPYLEFSRLVIGKAWQPTYNTKFGINAGFVDLSQQSRTQSGNLITDNKPTYKTLNFDLEWLTPSDRTEFVNLVKTVGVKQSVFASIFPNNSDIEKESLYQIYGKFTNAASLTHPIFSVYTTSISLEQI